jgi:hypothetical protein
MRGREKGLICGRGMDVITIGRILQDLSWFIAFSSMH